MHALLLALLGAVPLAHRVTDLAQVMRAEDVAALESELAQLERTDSTQVALLTVRSTGGLPIEQFSLDVAHENRLGQKGRDNGVLVVVAVDDRRVRIEVGYGLEARLTDGKAGEIIRAEMVPRFRQGDYSRGARVGVEAVIRAVRGEYQAGPPSKVSSAVRAALGDPRLLPLAMVIFVIIVCAILIGTIRSRQLRSAMIVLPSPAAPPERNPAIPMPLELGRRRRRRSRWWPWSPSERWRSESSSELSGPFADFTLYSDSGTSGDAGGFSGGGGDFGGGGGGFGGGGASGSW